MKLILHEDIKPDTYYLIYTPYYFGKEVLFGTIGHTCVHCLYRHLVDKDQRCILGRDTFVKDLTFLTSSKVYELTDEEFNHYIVAESL